MLASYVTDEKGQDLDPDPRIRIRGSASASGSVPKCHASAFLWLRNQRGSETLVRMNSSNIIKLKFDPGIPIDKFLIV